MHTLVRIRVRYLILLAKRVFQQSHQKYASKMPSASFAPSYYVLHNLLHWSLLDTPPSRNHGRALLYQTVTPRLQSFCNSPLFVKNCCSHTSKELLVALHFCKNCFNASRNEKSRYTSQLQELLQLQPVPAKLIHLPTTCGKLQQLRKKLCGETHCSFLWNSCGPSHTVTPKLLQLPTQNDYNGKIAVAENNHLSTIKLKTISNDSIFFAFANNIISHSAGNLPSILFSRNLLALLVATSANALHKFVRKSVLLRSSSSQNLKVLPRVDLSVDNA